MYLGKLLTLGEEHVQEDAEYDCPCVQTDAGNAVTTTGALCV